MLHIKNYSKIIGDFIEYKEYTLGIESITQMADSYHILVYLNRDGVKEDYIGMELTRTKKAKYRYQLYQTHMHHNNTAVTLDCIQNLDWFGYIICKMAGNGNWQMNIPAWSQNNPSKKIN